VTENAGAMFVETEVPEPGKTKSITVKEQKVLLCNIDGEVFAIENSCTHARVLLSSGRLIGGEIECPVHGARFDVRTGAVMCPPARKGLRSFPVCVVDGGVEVRISEKSTPQ
jgi:nitrite reductase/ring-hydroxylating ferredoxin subunit